MKWRNAKAIVGIAFFMCLAFILKRMLQSKKSVAAKKRLAHSPISSSNQPKSTPVMTDDGRKFLRDAIQSGILPSEQSQRSFTTALEAFKQATCVLEEAKAGGVISGCKLFMFGSTIAMGSWDGKGDIDLAYVNPSGWDAKTWPPHEVKLLMKDVVEAIRSYGVGDIMAVHWSKLPLIIHKPAVGARLIDASCHEGSYELQIHFRSEIPQEKMSLFDSSLATTTWNSEKNQLSLTFESGMAALRAFLAASHLITQNESHLPQSTTLWPSPLRAPELVGVEFDFSFRGHGIAKSWFLRQYMQQSPIVRIGLLFVKQWSKSTLLNHNKKGHFNSFAISILWLHFLLVRRRVTFVDPKEFIARPTASYSPIATYLPLLDVSPKRDSTDIICDEVANSVFDFFHYYARAFDWENNVVSICRSEPETLCKKEINWTFDKEQRVGSPNYYRICIRDPLEQDINLARHVDGKKSGAPTIRPFFERAFTALGSGPADQLLQPIG